MRTIIANRNVLVLGHRRENLVTQVLFFVQDWIDVFGDGTFSLWNRRSIDPAGYPVSFTLTDGVIFWITNSSDLDAEGFGECVLRYDVNGEIVKSHIYNTQVLPSLEETEEPPEPWESWVDGVLQAATDAQQSADDAAQSAIDAEMAATHGPYIGDNGHWFVWDANLGEYVDTGVDASNGTYTHNQLTPSDHWLIEHNLGRNPSVSVVDSAGSIVTGEVRYLDTNNIEIIFLGAFSGTAYLN